MDSNTLVRTHFGRGDDVSSRALLQIPDRRLHGRLPGCNTADLRIGLPAGVARGTASASIRLTPTSCRCSSFSFAIPRRLRPMGFAMDVSRSQWRIRRPSLRRNPCVSQFRREYLLRPNSAAAHRSRCLSLARLIAAPREPTTHDDLIEMNFGDWQGLGWDEISREQLDAWAADLWNYRPGGGESAAMVAIRWEQWITRMRQSDPQCLIAVTHAGVIRVVLARSGKTPDATVVAKPIPFGSIHQLTLD